MEDGLRGIGVDSQIFNLLCLNPCFNGRWSASSVEEIEEKIKSIVLILVLMEDGLREVYIFPKTLTTTVS